MDFHAFPLRIMEVPDKPQEAILKLGFSDGLYNRSKGGITYSGWSCEHLPYLVEFDNYGVSKHPGQPNPDRLAQVSIGYGDMMKSPGSLIKQKNTAATGCAMHSIG